MKKILIAAGGTGGHIYPGLAIADAIKCMVPDSTILFVGSHVGPEKNIISAYGYPITLLDARGFEKKIDKDTLVAAASLLKSRRQASALIKKEDPDVVIGTGGFVSAMLLLEAARRHYPTLIHEQNSYPGRANRMLGKFVDKIAISFDDAGQYFPHKKIISTGNPIRTVFKKSDREKCRQQLGLTAEDQLIVATGGSQGAGSINSAMTDWLSQNYPEHRVVYLLTGKDNYEAVLATLRKKYQSLPSGLHVVAYSEKMDMLFKSADLVVGRAGATTIAELAASGTPAILVPYPFAAGDHQTANAMSLAKIGGALVVPDDELNGDLLKEKVESLLGSPEKLTAMRKAVKNFGKPDADESVAREAIALMNKKKRK